MLVGTGGEVQRRIVIVECLQQIGTNFIRSSRYRLGEDITNVRDGALDQLAVDLLGRSW